MVHAIVLIGRLLSAGVSQAASPVVTTPAATCELSVTSIEGKGASVPYGNASIKAKPGQQVFLLKLLLRSPTGGKCTLGGFDLEGTDGTKAESVWGEMSTQLKPGGSTTFELHFVAAESVTFKNFRVSGRAVELPKPASAKPPAPGRTP